MSSGQIITVTGPLAPAELGPTDAHEHLFLATPAQPGDELADIYRAEAELEEGAATGLRGVIELTPIGLGRRPDLLRQLAESTGMAVVAATGYHRDAHYAPGHWVLAASEDALAGRVLGELREGMDDGDVRAGVIKGGASHEHLSAAEARRLRAIARASRTSGAPVVVHTEAGTFAPQIVDLLFGEGLAADRLTLAHLDRNLDAGLHAEIASRGVGLVYDTIGRTKYATDEARLDFIEAMVTNGHAGSLMLGLDLGRREYHRAWGGGPGMRHLLADFVPRLRERIDGVVDQLLVDNPRRAFAWA